MKKNSRIEMAREIIANLKREMDKPRITESVREGLRGAAPLAVLESARFEGARQEEGSSS